MSHVSKRKKLAMTVGLICLVVFVGFTGLCVLAWAQAGQLEAHGLHATAAVQNYTPSPAGVRTPATITVEFTPHGTAQRVTATANDDAGTPPSRTVPIVYDSADPASFALADQNPQGADVGFGILGGVLAVVDVAALTVISRKNF